MNLTYTFIYCLSYQNHKLSRNLCTSFFKFCKFNLKGKLPQYLLHFCFRKQAKNYPERGNTAPSNYNLHTLNFIECNKGFCLWTYRYLSLDISYIPLFWENYFLFFSILNDVLQFFEIYFLMLCGNLTFLLLLVHFYPNTQISPK